MFKADLDICPDGYNIDQTNFFLNNLYNRIDTLEKQNEALFKAVSVIESLENKIDLILKHLGIEIFEEETTETSETVKDLSLEEQVEVSESIAEDAESKSDETLKAMQSDYLDYLRNEIFSLKSIIKD